VKVKQILSILADVITSAFVFMMLTLAWHEFCHYVVLKALGGDGYIIYTLLGGFVIITEVPDELWKLVLVYLSGGLGCSLLYAYFYVWWLEEPADRYVRFVCIMYGISQAIYAVAELFMFIFALL